MIRIVREFCASIFEHPEGLLTFSTLHETPWGYRRVFRRALPLARAVSLRRPSQRMPCLRTRWTRLQCQSRCLLATCRWRNFRRDRLGRQDIGRSGFHSIEIWFPQLFLAICLSTVAIIPPAISIAFPACVEVIDAEGLFSPAFG